MLSPRLFHFILSRFCFRSRKSKSINFPQFFLIRCALLGRDVSVDDPRLIINIFTFSMPCSAISHSAVQGAKTPPLARRPLGGCLSVFLLWARPFASPILYLLLNILIYSTVEAYGLANTHTYRNTCSGTQRQRVDSSFLWRVGLVPLLTSLGRTCFIECTYSTSIIYWKYSFMS